MADVLQMIGELLASKKHGGQTFGGNTYGGGQYGGAKFGGNQYGASVPPAAPVSVAATPPGYAEGDVASRPAPPIAQPPAAGAPPPGAAPPTFKPQAPGQAMPPGDLVDQQTQANTTPPADATGLGPLGAPINIGAAPGTQGSVRQDLLSSIMAAIKNNTVNGQPPAWAANFGNLQDQQKT